MAMLKYSSCEIMDLKYPKTGYESRKLASKDDFNYNPEPGYIYISLRAISSRVNLNSDGFVPSELERHWETYRHAPNFLEHNNTDYRVARGVVADVSFHPDKASSELLDNEETVYNTNGKYNPIIWTPESHRDLYAAYNGEQSVNLKQDNWIELLVEVDANNFPKYAKALIDGKIDKFSMGTNVESSMCSICGNVARTENDYCDHIACQKGMWIAKEGKKILSYEDNRDISFFEISAVHDPADASALLIDIDTNINNEDIALAKAASRQLICFLKENNYYDDNVVELVKEVNKESFDFRKVAKIVKKINRNI